MRLALLFAVLVTLLGCRERLHDTPALQRARKHQAQAKTGGGVRRAGPPKELAAALNGGKQVFSDDFERDMLGPKWKPMKGTWRLTNGQIINHHADNAGFWLLEELPEGNVRIEFDVRSDSFMKKVKGEKKEVFPGDLKCEAFNTTPEHQSGYVFIFGGWNNKVNRIARLEEHGDGEGARVEDGPAHEVKPGHTYRMKVVRVANTVGWYADDKYLAHMTDDEFIAGRYFGFNNWRSHLTFDNVAVYDL